MLSAKTFVDLAAAHEDTKGNQKTLWLKGDIYSTLMMIGMQSQDMELIKDLGENVSEDAKEALTRAYDVDSKKYKDDVRQTVDRNRTAFNQVGNQMYEAKQYGVAAAMYNEQAEYADCIDFFDTIAVLNSGIAFEYAEMFNEAAASYEKLIAVEYRGAADAAAAVGAYRKAKEYDKALAIFDEARKKYPTDKNLLLEFVQTNLDAGKPEATASALEAIIAAEPDNKEMLYNIASVYIGMGDGKPVNENEAVFTKAEELLNKALTIDPNYVDAQYQLGAHLVTWGLDLQTAAKQTKNGDPNYDKWNDMAMKKFEGARIPLEKYIETDKENKSVLTILSQLYRSMGNAEKFKEYKQRADAITE